MTVARQRIDQRDQLDVPVIVAGDVENAPCYDALGKRLPEHHVAACLDGDEGKSFFSTSDYHSAKKEVQRRLDQLSAKFTQKLRKPTNIPSLGSTDLEKVPCKIGKPQESLASLFKELDRCEPADIKYKYFVGLEKFAGMSAPVRQKIQAKLSIQERKKLDDVLLRLNSTSPDALKFQEEVWTNLLGDLQEHHDVSWNQIQSALQGDVTNFAQLQSKIFGV